MNKINHKELHKLFDRIKEKNTTAYEELYEKYSTLVYQIAFSILKNKENAEDIMQNVFIKIGNLSQEKLPSKYEASWIYSVTKNEAISYIRKNKENLSIEEIPQRSNEDEIEKMLGDSAYRNIISYLEETEQQIISLKVDIGLSFKEIANLLNMPMGTVQWKYYKSLHSLKLIIGNLSLFIITAVISTKVIFSKHRKNTNNMVLEEDKSEQIEDSVVLENKEKQDSIEQNNRKEETILANEQEELVKGNQIQEQVAIEETNNINFLHIGLISLTSIFLLLTICSTIIFLKYQQKQKKKSSKK